jgi:hypothetical protein
MASSRTKNVETVRCFIETAKNASYLVLPQNCSTEYTLKYFSSRTIKIAA